MLIAYRRSVRTYSWPSLRPAWPRLALAIALFASRPAVAADETVELVYLQTGARLVVRVDHLPSPSTLNRFLRCPSERRYTLMDPRLIVRAVEAARTFGVPRVEIVSAFRTAGLVEAQRAAGRTVTLRSRHINGQALDIRLPGVDTEALCTHFLTRRQGGVGCYRRSRFIHIDVGPTRSWSG